MVWRDGKVFASWRDALVVPVPKKDNLNICDSCQGISLLDVAGKLLGRNDFRVLCSRYYLTLNAGSSRGMVVLI